MIRSLARALAVAALTSGLAAAAPAGEKRQISMFPGYLYLLPLPVMEPAPAPAARFAALTNTG